VVDRADKKLAFWPYAGLAVAEEVAGLDALFAEADGI